MDEKLKIPSSTCETPGHVLDTPETKPETCDQTEYPATTSTSVSEITAIMSLKSIPNIKSKGVVQKKLSIHSAKDNIQAEAESINQFVEQLLAAQEECNVNLVQINKKCKLFSAYLKKPSSSAEDLVIRLKSLTASERFINAEKHSNSLLSSIAKALKSIRNQLHLPFTTNSVLRKALKSLKKSMEEIVPKQEDRKAEITLIKELFQQELTFPYSANKKVLNEFLPLTYAVECIAAEQIEQKLFFYNVKESEIFISKQLQKIPSTICETTRRVLDTPLPKHAICKQTEYLATCSTPVRENIPMMSFESMMNIISEGVEQEELNIPSAAVNIQADSESISQFVEQLLAAQEECNTNLEQINEKFKLFSTYINNPTSSAKDLVLKLKSQTASEIFINAEKYSNSLLSSIEEALESIRNKHHLPFPANSVLRKSLKYLKKSMKKIIPKQEGRNAEITQIKESLAQELTLPPSAGKKVVNEFHSLKHLVECIVAEQNEQNMLFNNIRESRRFIKRQLQSQKNKLPKAEISGDTD